MLNLSEHGGLILRSDIGQSLTHATGNSQHNSRTTERRAFKFPDEKTDCDESEYDAN
jgi:hypothetical protein